MCWKKYLWLPNVETMIIYNKSAPSTDLSHLEYKTSEVFHNFSVEYKIISAVNIAELEALSRIFGI